MVGDGGFADMAAQDSFCSGTTCTIPIIYDQSGNGNHLRVTWWAYWLRNGAKPANAKGQKIKVGGHTVSGIMGTAFSLDVGYRTGVQLPGKASVTKGSTTVTFTSPQTLPANTPLFFAANTADCPEDSWPNNCKFKPFWTAADIDNATTVTLKNAYDGTASSSTDVWNHATKGMPVNDESEAMYSVLDAKRYSSYCCFSYGNAEMSGWDEGNATMECIYYGNCTQFGQSGGGSGPWVGADLENGMYEGYENGSAKVPSNTSVTGMDYVTAMVKGPSASGLPRGPDQLGLLRAQGGQLTVRQARVEVQRHHQELRSAPARLHSAEEARRCHPGNRRRRQQWRHRDMVRGGHHEGPSVGCHRRRRAGQHRCRWVREIAGRARRARGGTHHETALDAISHRRPVGRRRLQLAESKWGNPVDRRQHERAGERRCGQLGRRWERRQRRLGRSR